MKLFTPLVAVDNIVDTKLPLNPNKLAIAFTNAIVNCAGNCGINKMKPNIACIQSLVSNPNC